jgi:hypothetical protein
MPAFTAEASLYKSSGYYRLFGTLIDGGGAIYQLLPYLGGRQCGPCYRDNTGDCVRDCLFCTPGRPVPDCFDQTLPCPLGLIHTCPPLPVCHSPEFYNCGNTCCPSRNACCGGNCCSAGEVCDANFHCCLVGQMCGGNCTDLTGDPQNCGRCGNVCGGGQVCCNGTCTNLSNDSKNCGACENACLVGAECINGKCCQNPCPTLLGAECCDTGQVCNPGYGCGPPPLGPVLINYHQVGACGYFTTPSGLTSAGANQAYVVFEIESIDNSNSGSQFTFDPTKLNIHANTFFAPGTQFYTYILGSLAVGPPIQVAGGLKQPLGKFGALFVQTSNPDGAVEANQTSYFLSYQHQAGEPLVFPVKTNASQTSWPDTEDCCNLPANECSITGAG